MNNKLYIVNDAFLVSMPSEYTIEPLKAIKGVFDVKPISGIDGGLIGEHTTLSLCELSRFSDDYEQTKRARNAAIQLKHKCQERYDDIMQRYKAELAQARHELEEAERNLSRQMHRCHEAYTRICPKGEPEPEEEANEEE